ncbi:MAG: polysaccharide biosynthesis C-terminal domain-containing protein [Bacteroidales bacterium]|nr:polysaccharide biosynthesis C-terminal domain-containing protein [Bacteroidales bacterium]
MLKKIIHTFGIRAFSAVINLLIAVLLSRYLGPEGKGSQSIIITTISFILIFSNLVGGATLVYLVPRFEAYLLLVPSYAWTLLMGVASCIVLYFTGLVEAEFVLHISILAVINSFMSIHSNLLIGKQRIKESNQLVWLQSVILVISLLVSFLGFGLMSVNAYIISLYVSLGLCLLISTFQVREYLAGLKLFPIIQFLPVVSQMFRYGLQNQVAHITQLLSFRLSYYVLGEYKGLAAVGVFGNGISIAESIWLIAKSMSLVQYSWVANSDDREKSAGMTMKLIKLGFLLSLILMIPLLVLPVSAYSFIFGPGFGEVKQVIWTLVPGVLIYNFSILLGHYYSGTGRYYVNTRISSAGLVISVLLYFMLIPSFGISGAGLATSISYVFTSVLFLWFFAKEYQGWYKDLLITQDDFTRLKDWRKLF